MDRAKVLELRFLQILFFVFFESLDDSFSSKEGIQFMYDIGLIGQDDFLKNVE